MTFEEMKALLTEQILQQKLVTATISQPRMKSNEIKRIKLKPLMLKISTIYKLNTNMNGF